MATQSVKIGWRPYTPVVAFADVDAQAFISAAGITNMTQAAAINTLVVQLKTYGIWSKMKALYPMVGGTEAKHRFNLKDPRPVDAAFYLDFNGTWTHSSTGAKPDGLTGYANTKMNLFTTVGASSISHSTYVRLNSFKGVFGGVYSPVLMNSSWYESFVMLQSMSNTSVKSWMGNTGGEGLTGTVAALGGMIMGNRYNSTTVFTLRKDASTISTSASFSVRNFPTLPYYIGALNSNGTPGTYDSNEIAFYHIGDGLTDAEAVNFYTAVQTFQTTLGRNIGTAITAVSDSNAQAFIGVAGITDATQKTAVNNLVISLKSYGLWDKMKAIYPFVGGSATSHKFNLKDPRDLAAAYALTFVGGMTHTSGGAVPNGSNSYALTSLTTGTVLANNSQHLSFYSRTNQGSSTAVEMGAMSSGTGIPGTTFALNSTSWNSGTPNYFIARLSGGGYASYGLTPLSDTRGFAILSRTDLNAVNAYWNGTSYGQSTQTSIAVHVPLTIFGRAYNIAGSESVISLKTCAFASIGDGLNSTEAANLYTAVQAYQTMLGRQIGTPLLSAGQTGGLLDAYPNAAAAYSLRKLMSGYYGAAIRVRRSSDNTEQNIAFDANGGLDTTSMLNFVGGVNQIQYSEEFDNAYWTKNGVTVTTNTAIAPDGTMTADMITESGNLNHSIYSSSSNIWPAGTNYNASVYVKRESSSSTSTFAMCFSDGNIYGDYVLFDISNGTVVQNSTTGYNDSNFGSSITAVGNGWFRCSVWGTTTASSNRYNSMCIRFTNTSTVNFGYYAARATAKMYIWGYQMTKLGTDLQPYSKTTTLTAGNGFVTTWYDQSGNGNNALNTTASGQPQIVSSGLVNTIASKPSVKFTTSNMPFTQIAGSSGLDIFVVSNFTDVTGGGQNWNIASPILAETSGNAQDFALGAKSSKMSIWAENNGSLFLQTSATISINTPYIYNGYGSSTSIGVGFNGGNYVTGAGRRNDMIVRALGKDAASQQFTGNLSEVIVYTSIQTDNRTSINTNINSYYSIY